MNLKGRSFLKLLDFTPEEILYLLDLAESLKAKKKANVRIDRWQGKNLALIFEKTSTRTRCAFEVAAHDMGMGVTYLDPTGSQIGKKESIADTARVPVSYTHLRRRAASEKLSVWATVRKQANCAISIHIPP